MSASDPTSGSPADYDGDSFEDQDRPIAYHRWHARLAGSVAGGVFLSQAIYWARRTKNEGHWFYKTKEEWADETGLTRSELDAARTRLRGLGVLEERHRRLEARLYYRINFAALRRLQTSEPALPKAESDFRESDIQLSTKAESDSSNKVQRIPETTSETTTPPTPSTAAVAIKTSPAKTVALVKEPQREVAPAPNPGRRGLERAVLEALVTLIPGKADVAALSRATKDRVAAWFSEHYKPSLTPEMVEYARLETSNLEAADSGHLPYMLSVLERCMADPTHYHDKPTPTASPGRPVVHVGPGPGPKLPQAAADARYGAWPPDAHTWERAPDGAWMPFMKRDGHWPYGASDMYAARRIDNKISAEVHSRLKRPPTPEEVTEYVRQFSEPS